MSDSRPITDHKAAFLRSQIRLLSRPLQPSSTLHDFEPPLPTSASISTTNPTNPTDTTTETEEQPQKRPAKSSVLSDKVAQEIADKVNAKIKAHNRLIFSAQSQRHVAEQIDTLYWNQVSAEDVRIDTDTTWVKRVADLTEAEVIRTLPSNVDMLYSRPRHDGADNQGTSRGAGQEEDGEEQVRQRYTVQREQLVELCRRRDGLREKVEAYRRLKALLEPFEDARVNVQPNLVTRDGELARELERMRVLLARVGSKVAVLPRVDADTNADTGTDTELGNGNGNVTTDTDSARRGTSNQERLDAVFGAG